MEMQYSSTYATSSHRSVSGIHARTKLDTVYVLNAVVTVFTHAHTLVDNSAVLLFSKRSSC
jgi:hypothetical protein